MVLSSWLGLVGHYRPRFAI